MSKGNIYKEQELNALRLLTSATDLNQNHKKAAQWDLVNSETLIRAFQLSLENKVLPLFYEKFSQFSRGSVPASFRELAQAQLKDIEVYRSILGEIANVASQHYIEFMVFKTLKPFPYLGSDMDILLPSQDTFKSLINILQQQGLRVTGGGISYTLERKLNERSYLIDVHSKIAAGGLEYIDKDHLWYDRIAYKIGEGEAYVPPPEWELAILAAHSVFKEFTVSLADFIYALYLLKQVDKSKLTEIISQEGLGFSFAVFINTINCIHEFLYASGLDFESMPASRLTKFISARVKSDFIKNPKMPYVYRPYVPALAHLLKLKAKPSASVSIFKNFSNREMILKLFRFLNRFRR